MSTVVGQASAAATSVAFPTHQAGDLLLVFARGTAAAPSVPAASGTVPAWTTLQSGTANSIGLTVGSFVATAATTTTGAWTNATHICVLVLRPGAGNTLTTSAALSSVGNGNNTQTIIYPALTLARTDGTSMGVRCGTRTVAITAVGTAPASWTNQTIQPAGASALMSVHTRAALAANPTADTVTVTSSNAPYRAVTVEVREIPPAQSAAVAGVPSAQLFGFPKVFGSVLPSVWTTLGAAIVSQSVLSSGPPQKSTLGTFLVGDGHLASDDFVWSVPGVYPPGFVASITGKVVSGDGHVSLGVRSGQFGTVTVTQGGTAQSKPVGGVPSAQAFGVITRITGGVISSSSGVPSAQAFGTITVKTATAKPVGGVGSAQAFGTVTVNTVVRAIPVGLGSAQAFGAITTRSGLTKPVGGVLSAQAFGTPKAVVPQSLQVAGIASAQNFGALMIKGAIKPKPGGVPSAQAFGAIHVTYPQSVAVPGVPSAQAFGAPVPTFVWLLPSDCISSPDDSICGLPISGDGHVCGGESFVKESDCISSPSVAILDEFLVGDGTLVGGHSFVVESLCLDGDPPLLGVAVLGVAVISYGFLGTSPDFDFDPVVVPSYTFDLEPVEAV